MRSRFNKLSIWTISHVVAPKSLSFRTILFFRLKFLEEKNIDLIRAINEILTTYWVFIGRTDVEAENSNTLATWYEELTQMKRSWCLERLGAGGEGDDRGWDGWMASLTQWTWVWVNSGSWWWTERPGVLRFMGSQRVGDDWATELNWTDIKKWYTFKTDFLCRNI